MNPWIKWAISLERGTARESEMLRAEMLHEVRRLKLGFCDRAVFQRYLEASS